MKATGRPRVIWFDRLGRVRPALMPNLANDDPAAIALCCAFFGTGAIAIALRTQCLSLALRNIAATQQIQSLSERSGHSASRAYQTGFMSTRRPSAQQRRPPSP